MSRREIKTLEAHWSRALDAALHAVEAGRAARTLPSSFCALEAQRIAAERRWLESLHWP
jgi:hypothetical protein